MNALPQPVVELIAALRRLPGVGPRSAERMALHVVQGGDGDVAEALSAALLHAVKTVTTCERCGALTEAQPCAFCADTRRDGATLCVVERATDILSIEKSGTYRGRYHVLGGRIAPLDGVGPEELRIGELVQRLEPEGVREIILALTADVEGDATGHYLAKVLAGRGVRVSRVAQGLPAGTGLDFADELTLSRAIEGRREMT
jgi:recombination protein RecR